ncbi:acyl-coenzyme A thioesterase 9, mitochondrial-like [Heptranchias perlo]|uniref:acyl-coenzyme A thioesterase 9, mitochondrial-like n=1 Tax=Heptranchias perlo TaxID=212740 RepID=UPI00355A938F
MKKLVKVKKIKEQNWKAGVLLFQPQELVRLREEGEIRKVRLELQNIVGASKNWSEHLQSVKERTSLSSQLVSRQEDLPCRRMKDSYLEAYLPLGSQPALREKYVNVHEHIEFGRILEDLDSFGVSFHSRILPKNSVWMADTTLKSLEICHPEERNIYNKIFGGFLMRKAFELAWASACVYGGSRPYVIAVDDIIFQKPVEIGSLLYLSSQICYTEKNYIQVRVHSEVVDPLTKEHSTTNIFHFTFDSEKEMMQIIPKTYGGNALVRRVNSWKCSEQYNTQAWCVIARTGRIQR